MTCTQPGCTGTVVDGYCDVCGSPPDAAPVPSAAAGAVPGGASGAVSAATSPRGATPPAGAGADGAASTRTSSRLAATAMGSARTGRSTGVTRRVGGASTRLRAARLGAGLTTIATVPAIDASAAVMANPEVAEEKRFCPSCAAAVGRAVDGRPGRTEGFCPQCRSPYSFAPKLNEGDLVGGQYEVAGALAHGGLGWIYLARDRNVSDRWVVLKGLLNTGDADALAAAIAERQFLAQVEHPRIVEIYNFVTHDGAGYTVMEYVGGHSLKQLLKERMRATGVYTPFPLDQAIAYVLEILPAFEYLHDLGLVYCDFKPDNLIQIGDDLKLIDLGGVRRLDDQDSAIYGTVGYQAPEVADQGVSIASDVYTLGRTLLVLAMEFRGYQSTYVADLPPVDETPVFARYDSFYRLVAKACAPDPADRFATVAELRVQLHGVLREVVATDRVVGAPGQAAARDAAPSLLFAAPAAATAVQGWADLPDLRVDTGDPQVGWLATVDVEDPVARLAELDRAPERSAEVILATGRAALHAGRPDLVAKAADELLAADPWEWRAVWLQGLLALATNDGRGAQAAFNAVYGQVPGELAPKLALALACETSGEPDIAEALYGTCARTDAAYVPPAAFAMARIRAARGSVPDAVAALDMVAATSRAYTEARRQRAELLVTDGGLSSLAEAMASIHDVGIDGGERSRLTAAALAAALAQVRANGPQPAVRIGEWPAVEPTLRDGLERTYRELAAVAATPAERVALVDAANEVRRWTLL